MNTIQKAIVALLTFLLAAALFVGCSAPSTAQSATDSSVSAAAEVEPTAEPTAAPTQEPTPEPTAVPQRLKQIEADIGEVSRVIFEYDSEGRLTCLRECSAESDEVYLGIAVNYDENGVGWPSLPFSRPEFVGTPGEQFLEQFTLQESGIPAVMEVGGGSILHAEFDADGLPTYVAAAQDDLGYLITYDRDEAGQPTAAHTQYVYGHMLDGVDTPQEEMSVAPVFRFVYE